MSDIHKATIDYSQEYPAIEKALNVLRSRLSRNHYNTIDDDNSSYSYHDNDKICLSDTKEQDNQYLRTDIDSNSYIDRTVMNDIPIQLENMYLQEPVATRIEKPTNDLNDLLINLTTIPINKLKHLAMQKVQSKLNIQTIASVQRLKRGIINEIPRSKVSSILKIDEEDMNSIDFNENYHYNYKHHLYAIYFQRFVNYYNHKKHSKYNMMIQLDQSLIKSNNINYSQRFNTSFKTNCIDRLGKVKLAALYDKYRIYRYYFHQWIKYSFKL